MSVNKFLKQYGMMIGEGTFGALSGGAIGTYTAKKGGEDPSAVKTEAALGALVGAGGILGLRGMITGARKAKAINQFKKHDARFQSYVDGLTKREDRLAVVQQQLQDHSRDALLQNEYTMVRADHIKRRIPGGGYTNLFEPYAKMKTNPNPDIVRIDRDRRINVNLPGSRKEQSSVDLRRKGSAGLPTTFTKLQASINPLSAKLSKRRIGLKKLRGQQRGVGSQIRRTQKEIKDAGYDTRSDLISQGHSFGSANKQMKRQIEVDSAALLGQPQRSVAFIPVRRQRTYDSGQRVSKRSYKTDRKSTPRTRIIGHESFDLFDVSRVNASNYTKLIEGLRAIPNASPSEIRKLHTSVTGSNRLPTRHMKELRRIAKTPGVTFGFKPVGAQGQTVFPKARGLDPFKAQQSEGLRYRQKDMQVRTQKAQQYNDVLSSMIAERKRILSDVKGSVDALYREPRELQRQMQNMKTEQAKYLEEFGEKKGKSITRTFLGLGG